VVPGLEWIEIAAGPAVGDALEGLGETGFQSDVVHLRRLKERGDCCPGRSTALAAGEETVLSRNCLGPDGALSDFTVELGAAVGDKTLKDGAPRGGMADRLYELRLPGDPCQGFLPGGGELVGDARLRTLVTSCFFNLP